MLAITKIIKTKLRFNSRAVAATITGLCSKTKTRSKIRAIRKEKEKLYKAIGEKYAEKYETGFDITFEEDMRSFLLLKEKEDHLCASCRTERSERETGKCAKCGKNLVDDALYCPYCGERIGEDPFVRDDEEIIEITERNKMRYDDIPQQNISSVSTEGGDEAAKGSSPQEKEQKEFFDTTD